MKTRLRDVKPLRHHMESHVFTWPQGRSTDNLISAQGKSGSSIVRNADPSGHNMMSLFEEGRNFAFQIKLIFLIDFYHSLKKSLPSVDNLEEYGIGINTRLTLWEAEI